VLYVTGRKGIGWHRFRELELENSWSGFSAAPMYRNAQEISEALLEAFNAGPTTAGWTRSTWSAPISSPC
jgi:F0F1-type ATP synthase, gamma subunit